MGCLAAAAPTLQRRAARPLGAALALAVAAGLWFVGAVRRAPAACAGTGIGGPAGAGGAACGGGGAGGARGHAPAPGAPAGAAPPARRLESAPEPPAGAAAAGQEAARPRQAEGWLEDAAGPDHLEAFLNALGLFYMFLALAIVCDEFFMPSLDVLSERLSIPPDVAGATFMAAGGSAPEFFTAMAGMLQRPPGDVGIFAIMGSAVFNVLFVIGMCGIAAPDALYLTWYPLARDCCFYMVHLLSLIVFFYDGQIEWWESLVLFCLYIVYCSFMAFSERVELYLTDNVEYRRLQTDDHIYHGKEEVANGEMELSRRLSEMDMDQSGFPEARAQFRHRRALKKELAVRLRLDSGVDGPVYLCPPRGGSCKDWSYYVLSFPIVFVLVCTVPDCRRGGCCWKSLFPATFVMSILWVFAFSGAMVRFAGVVGEWAQIDGRILALTLLSAGISVPDLLTSMISTLQGHGDMAIASSIGGNIFDITVGLPVPWLLYTSYYGGEPVRVQSGAHTLALLTGVLLVALAFVFLSIRCCKWVLSRPIGYMMLFLYLAFMAGSIYEIEREV